MAKKKRQQSDKPFIHKTAVVEDDVKIGKNTKVWHFAHVRRGTRIGENCVISKAVFIDFESEIGDNVKIQNHSVVYHKAILKKGVFVGPNVCFTNDKNPRAINPDGSLKSASDWEISTITIDQGASIGGHSVILPGVSIGQFAMVGSGSVITKDVPPFALVFGNPARIKGFVCACGKKINKYQEQEDKVVGFCDCGLKAEIDQEAYQQLKAQLPKKKIWLR